MKCLRFLLLGLIAIVAPPVCASALEPPPPGMIEEMRAEGTLDEAIERARELGNHKMKAPLRGLRLGTDNPHSIADLISQHFGRSLAERSASAIGSSSPQEFDWVELDLNHDRTVDERDVLALGFPRPKVAATLPTLGTSKVFCLIIEFSDYEHWFDKEEFEDNLFGDGDTYYYYRGLQYYYKQASYQQLTIDGSVYGWYQAEHERTYYHPNNNNSYPEDTLRREQLIFEAIDAADDAGADFSQYDNDGDGEVDYFLVVWTGPHGAWASFWWGYQTRIHVLANKTVDGVRFGTYSWQWEQYYGFNGDPPNPPRWDPLVTIHETGHALGLPDYYDYDDGQGPDGGCGGMDMMDANHGDHNCFSKYCLGWLSPTVAFTNLNDEEIQKSNAYADAVVFMPGFDPVSPWSEYFMAQVRKREGNDNYSKNGYYPTDGRMAIWHVDAQVEEGASWPLYYAFKYDNSYTEHKLLRLMEADGLEEIETGDGYADIGDYYNDGEELSPTSTPNSDKYDGSNPGITVDDISVPGDTMTADFTLYTSSPPDVTITSPDAGDTLSGDVTVTIDASDDSSVAKVQLIIDGLLVAELDSSPYEYTWNTLVDFNKTMNITARAWDEEDQVGSDTISVTVSNTGVASMTDDFESGLGKWRVINDPADPAGTFTEWSTRTSPSSPTPPGSGKEAWVKPEASTTWYTCSDHLRSERIDATSFTKPLHVKFYYRCRSGFSLWATTDNGSSWDKLADISPTNNWGLFTGAYDYQGDSVYLRLYYGGSVRENTENGRGANIDDFVAQQAPSDPPTLSFTSPADGAEVSGSTTFSVDADDDGTVEKVFFYLHGSLENTDTAPPWEYTRNTVNDDNHPGIVVMAYAIDDDDIPSEQDEITVVFKNERPYPVMDDLEDGSDDWYVNNDSKQPQWQLVDDEGNSGSHSFGWVTSGSWEESNWDGLMYKGDPPSSGYQTIDLSGSDVESPVLRFFYKADFPDYGCFYIYFYNTWTGYTILDIVSGDQSSWIEKICSLDDLTGHSGRIVFYARNGSATNGTGLWMDDIRVENLGPFIESIDPDRATEQTEVTITGSGFGDSRGSNYVTFGGDVNPEDSDYVSWGNNEIKVKIPNGAESGDVTVTVDSVESNGYDVRVILGPPNLVDTEQF